MGLYLPNIPTSDYIPVITGISEESGLYNIRLDYTGDLEDLEETLGMKSYVPRAKWWNSDQPILSLKDQNVVKTVPSVLAGETATTTMDILRAFESYGDGTVLTSSILSGFDPVNIASYIGAALGIKIGKDSIEKDPLFWEELLQNVFGNDEKAPTLVKGGKTYIPKKMVAKVYDELEKASKKRKIDLPDVSDVAVKDHTAPVSTMTKYSIKHGNFVALLEQIPALTGWTDINFPYSSDYPFSNLSSLIAFAKTRPDMDGYISYRRCLAPSDDVVNDIDNLTIRFIYLRRGTTNVVPVPFDLECYVRRNTEADENAIIAAGPSAGSQQFYVGQDCYAVYRKPHLSNYFTQTTHPKQIVTWETVYPYNISSQWLITGRNRITGVHPTTGTPFEYVEMTSLNISVSTSYETIDFSGLPTTFDGAIEGWKDNAIAYPGKIGVEEREEWYPITVPDVKPWLDGWSDTKEKAQTGTLTTDRTDTKDEVLDNTLPDTIINTDTKTDIKPNPTPTPLPAIPGAIPTVDLGLAQLYNPTAAQLKSFSRWLWGVDFDLDQLKKLFADPMQAIIGLHAIYATPVEGGTSTIQVGYINSGVTSNVVKDMFTTINCGTVHIPESFGDVRDYNPYTTIEVYLPFIGMQQLNTDDVIGSDVTITYKVDVLTGACIALISVKSSKVNGILYSFTGNCAIQLPITSGNYIQAVASLIAGVAKTVTGAVAGGLAGGLAGAAGGISGLDKTSVHVSGGLTSNAGAMGVKKPFVVVRRPITYDAARFNQFYGYPANKYVQLAQLTGFVRVKDINLSGIVATEEEITEITSLLKEGVIL